jgi:hypothetical protein
MPKDQDTITPQQLRRIAAAIRWRAALSLAELLWQDMTPEEQQRCLAEARNIVTHAGLKVAAEGI